MNSLTVSTSKDLENILNHLDAVVYVSDIDTYELLYMNQYAIANIAGDKVLEAIGFTLKTFTSETTIVARTGGEEFAIFLPIKSKKNAKAFAQQIRGAIGKIRVPYYKDVLSCTASAGMSTGYTSIQISSLMRDADRALYRAKASGRDSLCEG